MKVKSSHADMASDQQRNVMRTLLMLTFLPGLMFSILNYYRGLYFFSVIELFMSLIAFLFFLKIKESIQFNFFKYLSYIFLFLFCSCAAIAIWFDSVTSIIVWIMLTPLLSYFMLGRRLGAALTILVSVVLLVIFTYRANTLFPSFSDFLLFLSNVVACLIAIWFLVHAYAQGGIYHHKKLSKMAMEDQLTGLYNRSTLQSCFDRHKNDNCLSLAIIDIDWFKKVNDTYGHDIGDKALVHFSRLLKQKFDDVAYTIRLGGEEFAIILPDANIEVAYDFVSEFLETFRNSPVQSGKGEFTMTFSAGVAQYPQEANDFLTLQKLADRRLYNAKNHGRNHICRWYKIEDGEID